MANLFQQFVQAKGGYWRVDNPTPLGALFCLLQADVAAIPQAAKILRYEYKGSIPMNLEAWADAIDAAYLAGF